ncbi:SNF2 family DNA-dependent ATPase [Rhizoctonia solani AG-1 IA]|uniref:SNF2 family DNA-dependent ATPase n=1 Tax=Thanatephorus cucumeris (strain AG1-IA) TaxID=983506 RepID=L8WRU3_THACA|nr:SNF2 family DNA-dependent ATPase [Rhizoctonia solani AG-1 IA]
MPIPRIGSVLGSSYNPGKLPGEGGISMPEPHPYRPSGPGAPFKPPTMVATAYEGGVTEDAEGEKFNIEIGGEDFKSTPDDAQRALKELVEGAIGAGLDGLDMKDATVKGFREGITLMPHQVQGRAWMRERETGKKCGGILMGLGKTIQTLTRVVEGKPTEEDRDNGYTGGTLIICPVGLIAQWESEIKKMCLKVRTISHHGPSRTKVSKILENADVVITSYQVVSSEHAAHLGGAASSAAQPKKKTANAKAKKRVRRQPEVLCLYISDSDGGAASKKKSAGSNKPKPAALFGVKWWRIVLDEAQNIKNRTTKAALACCALRGRNKWCLTGTPIQNSVEELYSLFKFLGVRPLNDWDEFRTTIAQPVKQGRSTRIVLKAIMLRRTKDMTINGAPLLNLPGRKVETLMCDFDEDERAFYEALEQKTELTLNKFIKAGTVMKNYTTCDHPSLVSKDFQKDIDAVESKPAKKDDEEEDELADLFQKMGVDKRALTCTICQTELPADADDEKYCEECAANLVAQSRRKSVAAKSGLPPSSAKIRKMVALLEEIDDRSNGEDKTIVFSQFTTMLDLLEPFLKDADISFTRLDGSMLPKDREVALDKIRNSSRTKVILISFKAGSTGWAVLPAFSSLTNRVTSLGQTKDVHIYKLTIAHTVEERILKLQDAKRDLAKAALSGDKLNNNRLRLDDIMKLFNKHSHEDSDDE